MTTLTDIAAALREHSPDALPRSLRIDDGRLCFVESGKDDNGATDLVTNWYTPLPDDIAEAVLIAAMLQDCKPTLVSWGVASTSPTRGAKSFNFDRHGGFFPAVAKAWRWHKDIQDDLPPPPATTSNPTDEGRPSPPPVRAGGSALPPPESQ